MLGTTVSYVAWSWNPDWGVKGQTLRHNYRKAGIRWAVLAPVVDVPCNHRKLRVSVLQGRRGLGREQFQAAAGFSAEGHCTHCSVICKH